MPCMMPVQVPVAVIHPGVVFTDMLESLRTQRGVAPDKIRDNSITPEASAEGIWRVLEGVTMDNSGQYWDAAKPGERLDW